jgi:hypothetical protein
VFASSRQYRRKKNNEDRQMGVRLDGQRFWDRQQKLQSDSPEGQK